MDAKTVIGLEVHVELSTRTKMFCGCSTAFGAPPNSQVCPVCLGMPGVLPVINKTAFDYALKVALALDCRIAPLTKFDRKNYYYPDLPKNYQISQYDMPFSSDGHLDIHADATLRSSPLRSTSGAVKTIPIIRVHLEEDAGKLIHSETEPVSYVDLNRTGVPLLEIVTQPDMSSPAEAYEFLTSLKLLLRYLDVSDCNMEEGSLRCDANINLHVTDDGRTVATPIAEIKNMNSFKAVQSALAYETKRQLDQYARDRKTIKDAPKTTRLWNEDKGVTGPMRQKEEAHDYRYFPEPDLPPIEITSEWVDRIRATLPEFPEARRARFVAEYSIPDYDADVLIQDRRPRAQRAQGLDC